LADGRIFRIYLTCEFQSVISVPVSEMYKEMSLEALMRAMNKFYSVLVFTLQATVISLPYFLCRLPYLQLVRIALATLFIIFFFKWDTWRFLNIVWIDSWWFLWKLFILKL